MYKQQSTKPFVKDHKKSGKCRHIVPAFFILLLNKFQSNSDDCSNYLVCRDQNQMTTTRLFMKLWKASSNRCKNHHPRTKNDEKLSYRAAALRFTWRFLIHMTALHFPRKNFFTHRTALSFTGILFIHTITLSFTKKLPKSHNSEKLLREVLSNRDNNENFYVKIFPITKRA